VAIAHRHGLKPSTLAIAFVRSRWFVTSTIIGGTSVAHLQESLESLEVSLTPELMAEIDAVHSRYPNPAP